jgi:hypothetical protein
MKLDSREELKKYGLKILIGNGKTLRQHQPIQREH